MKRRDSDSFERMQMFPKCPETRRRDSDSDSDDDDDNGGDVPKRGHSKRKPNAADDDDEQVLRTQIYNGL